MCCDLGNLSAQVAALDSAGVDQYHIDIMDGEFVPNFALSWADFATVRNLTTRPMDVHLMVKNASVHLPYAYKYGANIIYVHYETGNVRQYLTDIKNHNCMGGVAINPETAVSEIAPLFDMIDSLLVMRVNPGFAGQKPVPLTEDKIAQLTAIKNRKFTIKLDGCVSPDVITKWSERGVEEFVCGTASGMFGSKRNNRPFSEIVSELRQGR